MSELVATMVGALIAASALYITTGPALGAVRSRRALRELLEIRGALDTSDSARRDKVNTALDKEFELLIKLGDTAQRYAIAAMSALGALVLVGWIAALVPALLIQEQHKEIIRYVSAGAFVLASIPLYIFVSFAFDRATRWRGRIGTVAVGSLAFVGLAVSALVVVQETTYYRQLTAL